MCDVSRLGASLTLCEQIPEYCSSQREEDVGAMSFELVAAMDEVVNMGNREPVTLSQICTLTEMESHEEKIFEMVEMVSVSLMGFP